MGPSTKNLKSPLNSNVIHLDVILGIVLWFPLMVVDFVFGRVRLRPTPLWNSAGMVTIKFKVSRQVLRMT